jgi:hypothetical protein
VQCQLSKLMFYSTHIFPWSRRMKKIAFLSAVSAATSLFLFSGCHNFGVEPTQSMAKPEKSGLAKTIETEWFFKGDGIKVAALNKTVYKIYNNKIWKKVPTNDWEWNAMKVLPDGHTPVSLAIKPGTPPKPYVTTETGLGYYWDKDSKNWIAFNANSPRPGAGDISINAATGIQWTTGKYDGAVYANVSPYMFGGGTTAVRVAGGITTGEMNNSAWLIDIYGGMKVLDSWGWHWLDLDTPDPMQAISISIGTDGTVGIIGEDHKAYIYTGGGRARGSHSTWDELYFNDGESLGLDEIFVENKDKIWVGQTELARLWCNVN